MKHMGEEGSRRVGRWGRETLRRRPVLVFAGSLSLCVHLALLVVLAVVVLDRPLKSVRIGSGETPLAVLSEADLRDSIQVDLSDDAPTDAELTDPDVFTDAESSASTLHADLASLDVGDLSTLSGSGGAEVGEGVGAGAVGGGAASFFGVEARGTRFAYIVDVSGSMAGDRLRSLQGALSASIQGLGEGARFSIVLFSSDVVALTRQGWVEATARSVRDMLILIRGINASGGTNPLPAFELIYAMTPPPDAIYFMTDGIFTSPEAVAQLIDRMNKSGGGRAPIHCITFVDRDAEEIMRVIARRSGGTYTHIGGGDEP